MQLLNGMDIQKNRAETLPLNSPQESKAVSARFNLTKTLCFLVYHTNLLECRAEKNRKNPVF
jgi:hypothetical protein